jgi:hypothetical protein
MRRPQSGVGISNSLPWLPPSRLHAGTRIGIAVEVCWAQPLCRKSMILNIMEAVGSADNIALKFGF